MMLSKKATSSVSNGEESSYFVGLQEFQKNPYDATHNPSGIIQMGLAENQVSMDLLQSWVAKNSHVTSFTDNGGGGGGGSIFKELALFQDYHGLPAFKKGLAEFMSEIRGKKVNFDPNKLVLTAGATSANETLMFCLAEPGEAFLIPTPYYPGYDRDLKWRTGVEIVPIICSSSTHFKITESALHEAYGQAQCHNLKVKGVLVTNPSNPMGTTLTRDELNHLITFAMSKSIHIVSDEIYSATVFTSPSFISLIEAVNDRNDLQGTNIRSLIHIVYSLSKDFGLPGFRVGMIYSNNEMVISAATKMSSFGLVSSQTQHLISNILGDKKFTRKFVKENQTRLKKRKEMLVLGLRNAGLRCLKSNAGLFCWVDMRDLLSSSTFEAEMELWKKILSQVKLNISPGSSCHCIEPGWFRICFANMSKETLIISMQRIKTFVDSLGRGNWQNQQQPLCGSKGKLVLKWFSRLAPYDNHERSR